MNCWSKVVLLVVCAVFAGSGSAQTFTGTVVDKETNAPLAAVNVYFVDLETGTTTNAKGVFVIEHAPRKRIHIQLSYVGYRTSNQEVDLATVSEGTFALERSHLDLKEVLVSVPSGRLQRESVTNVEQRKLTDLQQVPTASLAEAISNMAGVDRNSTGTGIGKPVIRGLSGNRIVTYAQGIRIENQQWGAEHGLGVGEAGIESVEVIKGPASVLYGSDALGGVLYFVDERYAEHNTFEAYVKSRFLENSLGTSNNVGAKLHQGKFKLNLFGAYASNADYRVPQGELVDNTRFDEKNFKTSIGFDHKNWISNLRYSFLQNDYGITESAQYGTSTARGMQLPYQAIGNHALSLHNALYTGRSKLDLVLGYTNNHRQEFEDDLNVPRLDMELGTFTYNLKWFSPKLGERTKLIVGSQGMHQSNTNNGSEILIPDAVTQDVGGFATVDVDLEKIQLQGGVRADHRRIDAQAVMNADNGSPALVRSFGSLSYSGGAVLKRERTTYRANVSSGFRAPNTSELLSNGVHDGTNRFERGDATLRTENATQLDLTFDFQDEHFSFTVNPYYSTIQNFIYLTPTDTVIDDYPAFAYARTNATLYGGEAGVHYHPHGLHWLHIESTFSMVHAQRSSNEPLPLIPAQKLNSTIKADLDQQGTVRLKNVFVQHIYRFAQDRNAPFETPTPAYHLLHAGFNITIETKGKPIELSAGVKNLLNARYIDHLSRFKVLGIPDQGRGFYVGLSMAIDRALGREPAGM